MREIMSEAWVLYRGPEKSRPAGNGDFRLENFTIPGLTDHEVLTEPIYGCWEANMTHALERRPVDICRQRGEEKVVIGNAGVVRILEAGASVTTVKPGDICLVFCNGIWDEFGYPKKILAYDAPNSIGLLAKRTKLHEKQVIPLPQETRYSLEQWAAFSLRYVTAWANWELAYGCWRLQTPEENCPTTYVWGWGGGVSLAEVALAKFFNCEVAMISSSDERLELIRRTGIDPVDRRRFMKLDYDESRYTSDPAYRRAYQESEQEFLTIVKEYTRGAGVSIFVDFIGLPVFIATIKALGRRGVITTAGWKLGMKTSIIRAIECINRHIHVHTHYARYSQGVAAVGFAERNGWMPDLDGKTYGWDDIPLLARDYSDGKINSYFPIYQINPL